MYALSMLYSTLEEAWSTSSLVEPFSPSCKKDDCDRIIAELLNCDGCLELLREKLGRSSFETNPFTFAHSFLSDNGNFRMLLLTLALILTVILLIF